MILSWHYREIQNLSATMSEAFNADEVVEGDLGLGDGLRPGSLPTPPCEPPEYVEKIPHPILPVGFQSDQSSNSGFTTPEDSDDEVQVSLMPIPMIQELKDQYAYLNPKTKRCTETLADDSHFYDERYFRNAKNGNQSKSPCENEDSDRDLKFPVYADVPYGTSIKQQKELFYHSIDELRKKMSHIISGGGQTQNAESQSAYISGKSDLSSSQPSCEDIAMKLAQTLQEVEDLKAELETCEQRLDSKYKAIEILKKQADESQLYHKTYEKMSKDTAMKLAQVEYTSRSHGDGRRVASLVVEKEQDLGDSSAHLVPSARGDDPTSKDSSKPKTVPLSKYKRMCQENKSLMEVLEARTEELRKVSAHKMAVERENDELLALLDIQERAKYEKSRSVSSEENYFTYTSTELAILGACRCRITAPDPCGCAHAGANLKKENSRIKQEVQQYKNRRDEAFQTVDAYRKAFEEQLARNKALTSRLATLGCSNSTSRASKTKSRSAFRWLIGNLNDDEISDGETSGPGMSESELITYLTEMVHEKKEVLAHQKLASQILADRAKVLEEKLAQYETDDPAVFL